ncbi:MAG: HAD-IC family P-type ATPase, partial [bacterium]|nr:HAD-IC family P-type ATPase [bacterium]
PGRGVAVVTATGKESEVGKIARLTEAAVEPKTPLEKRIAQFGRYIIYAAAGLFLMVLFMGVLRAMPFSEVFMVAISQVVSLVPEGLPVAMTVALAVGVQRMARRGAIVRRLSAVETLGSTTVICTDKTGTLTRNVMMVTRVYLPPGRLLEVTGEGYNPEGDFLEDEKKKMPAHDDMFLKFLEAAVLCNDASLEPPAGDAGFWKPVGDPTEAALVSMAMKGGVFPEEMKKTFPREAEIPFHPARKMMATQHKTPEGDVVYIKGAPEAVLELCSMGEEARCHIHHAGENMAHEALRLLAFAVVPGAVIDMHQGFEAFRGKAVFLGLVGKMDPPRPEVRAAVRDCFSAGVRPVMVTGDHKSTGLAVAKMLGMMREGDIAVDGRELSAWSDEDLKSRIGRVSVFARVHPEQKLRIVEAFQSNREVVAMTGDGVNDAPALARADVGVAMGITGTEVAKGAAKIVITDDNFATIVRAVEEGRIVYRNIKKLILYLVTTSLAEILVLLAALFIGFPLPLAAVQILWINLVTDGVLTVPLVLEPKEGDEMRRPPVSASEPLMTRAMIRRLLFMAPSMFVSVFGWFVFRLAQGVPFDQVRTETFTVLAVCQWFNILNCLSDHKTSLNRRIFRGYWLWGGLLLGNALQVAVVFVPF